MLTDAQRIDFEVIVEGSIAALGGTAQQTITKLYYRRTNFANPFSAADLRSAFHTAVQADWLLAASVSWSWVKTRVRCINDSVEAESVGVVGAPGAVAGDMSPSFVAALIRKSTPLRGSFYNGRLFFPGIAESGTLGNALTAGQRVLMDNLATDLSLQLTDVSGITYIPILLSPFNSDLSTSPSVVFATPITAFTATSVITSAGSRRSRQ